MIRELADAVECGEVEEDVGQHLQADVGIGITVIPTANDGAFRAFAGHKGGRMVCMNHGLIGLVGQIRCGRSEGAQLIAQPFAMHDIGLISGEWGIAPHDRTVHESCDAFVRVQSNSVEIGTVALQSFEKTVDGVVFNNLVSLYLGDTVDTSQIFKSINVSFFHGDPPFIIIFE